MPRRPARMRKADTADDPMPNPGIGDSIGDKWKELSPAMTACGISSLMICRDELKLAGRLDADLDRSILLTAAGALEWLGEKGVYVYSEGDRLTRAYGDDGKGMLYDMFSYERAGVFAGVRHMGDVEWYRQGAEILVTAQAADGHWPALMDGNEHRMMDSCYAVLFLKRAVVPVHDTPKRRIITHGKRVTGEPVPSEPAK